MVKLTVYEHKKHMLMYKQRQYLKRRAETDWSSHLRAAPEVDFTLRAGSRGWWDVANKKWPSCLILTRLYNTACDWWWGSSDDGKKGDCGEFVTSTKNTSRTDDNRATVNDWYWGSQSRFLAPRWGVFSRVGPIHGADSSFYTSNAMLLFFLCSN